MIKLYVPVVNAVAPVVSMVTFIAPLMEAALVTAKRSALEFPRLNLNVAPAVVVNAAPANVPSCCKLQILTAPSVMSNVFPPRFKVAPAVAVAVLPMLMVVALPGCTAKVPVPPKEIAVLAKEPAETFKVPALMTVPPV